MNDLYNRYLGIKAQMDMLKSELEDVQAEIYLRHKARIDDKGLGTTTVEEDGFRVKIITKENVTVDQTLAKTHPEFFTLKYNFSRKFYEKSPDEVRSYIDRCITVKPAKPTFSVEQL